MRATCLVCTQTQEDGETPIAYNRVAGVVVVGNEDGARHVIGETNGALDDIGYSPAWSSVIAPRQTQHLVCAQTAVGAVTQARNEPRAIVGVHHRADQRAVVRRHDLHLGARTQREALP